MRPALLLLLLPLLLPHSLSAEEIRYVSDKQFVPLRSGSGKDYRIIHRGIPSGTRMTIARTSSDGDWSEITTDKGTSGWIRTQYLMSETPAANKVIAATERADSASKKSAALTTEVEALKAERAELLGQISSSGSELGSVSNELIQLKQVSGKAVQLDLDNRRLVMDSENLRSEVEMLKAEKQRLMDKLRSEDFFNGAMAVLLGVIIALVAPRLVKKRRKDSGWA